MTAWLDEEMFPAASISRTVSWPPAAIAACNSAEVVKFRLKFNDVSPAEIVVSVAIVIVPRINSADPPVAWPATIVAVAVIFVEAANKVLATTVPPTGVTVNAVGAAGATVSITSDLDDASEPLAAATGTDRTASLPATSLMVPPFNTRADVDCTSRSLLMSPVWTT